MLLSTRYIPIQNSKAKLNVDVWHLKLEQGYYWMSRLDGSDIHLFDMKCFLLTSLNNPALKRCVIYYLIFRPGLSVLTVSAFAFSRVLSTRTTVILPPQGTH